VQQIESLLLLKKVAEHLKEEVQVEAGRVVVDQVGIVPVENQVVLASLVEEEGRDRKYL
jgi:hypothetical protein